MRSSSRSSSRGHGVISQDTCVCVFNDVNIKGDEMSGTCRKHGDMKNLYNIVMSRSEGMDASGRLYTLRQNTVNIYAKGSFKCVWAE